MAERSMAQLLLSAAAQDLEACALLCDSPVGDAVVGFHAQQAVEKSIKAVLSFHRIEFRRTHDLAWLMDLLEDRVSIRPPDAEWLDELNPYAVEARYGSVDPEGLDRKKALQAAQAVWKWAMELTRSANA
jgi:HEPN domain-containing protein